MSHLNYARSINYLFSLAENRDISFAVQSTNITDITTGETPFPTGPKDLYLPSNKVETTPATIRVLVSEDYSEWLFFYKWLLKIKNSSMADEDLRKGCELVTLNAQNEPTVKFSYLDAFPTSISGLEYSIQEEARVLTFDVTLRYNIFTVTDKDGNIYDDNWNGDLV